METSELIASGSRISVREEAGREVSYLLLKREADRKTVVGKLHGGRSAQERVAEFLSSPFLPQQRPDPLWHVLMPGVMPDHCTVPHSTAALSGLSPHSGAVFPCLTSHCMSPHSTLCSGTALPAPVSPPCCR